MAQQVNVGVISTVQCATAVQTPTPAGGTFTPVVLAPAAPTVQPQPTPVSQNWIPQAPLPNTSAFIIGIIQTKSVFSA